MRPSTLVFPTIAFAAAFACPAVAQRVAEVEPNNTSAAAQAIVLGSQVDATLAAGEEDWFEFSTTGGNAVLISHGPTDVDTVFELFDSTGTTLLAVNDDTDAFFSALSVDLAAGTYQLRVTGWGPTTAGPYQLELGEVATVGNTGTENEPNDSLGQADPLAGGDVIDGVLGSGDEDWYRIDLTAAATGVWFEIAEGAAPWVSSHRWELRDSGGGLLGPTTEFGPNAGDSSPSEIRSSTVRSWPAGTYYLVIKESSFPLGFGNAIPQGGYRLRLATMPVTGAPASESEPNDTVQQANAVTPGSSIAGSISASGGGDPVDIYGPFVISGPTVMQFQTRQGSSGPLLDSTIRLLDDDGNTVQQWTVGNLASPTSHARATVVFSRVETYYLEVRSPGNGAGQSGSYVLEVGAAASLHTAASYDLAEVNGICLGSNGLRPTLTVDSPGERPVLGTNMSRTVEFLPPLSPFFLVEGLSDEIGLGSIPLPYDLGPLGAPDCGVFVDPLANQLILGSPSGTVALDNRMPTSVVFRGVPIYEQVVALDLAANALGITASNYARKLLGDR